MFISPSYSMISYIYTMLVCALFLINNRISYKFLIASDLFCSLMDCVGIIFGWNENKKNNNNRNNYFNTAINNFIIL